MGRPRKKHFAVLKTIFLYLILPLLLVVLPLLFSVSHELSAAQANFRRGAVPAELTGDYKGEQKLSPAGWYGKTFDAESKTGANLYLREGGEIYPDYEFSYAVDFDIRNHKQEVIKLTYSKPFFMKLFVSEIVVYKGELVGKTYLVLPLNTYLTTGHFTLTPSQA